MTMHLGYVPVLGSSAAPAAPPPDTIRSAARATVLVDGESVDRTLGQILRRRPRSGERPRWDRVMSFARERFGNEVHMFFYLVERDTPQFQGFVGALRALEIRPVRLKPMPEVEVVDEAILATLPHVPPHDPLLLLTHDGGYMDGLELLLSANRRVAIAGFPELLSHRYKEHGDIEIYDLESDVAAFSSALPRDTRTAVDLSEFDPRELM